MDPQFWEDPKRAETILKAIKFAKKSTEEYNITSSAVDDFDILLEYFKAGEASEEEVSKQHKSAITLLDELEFQSTMDGEEDSLTAILTINSGAGGTESCDWSEMLLRMYIMWADKEERKITMLSRQDGDVAGIKSVSFEVGGDYAYGYLKGENGVHRLVRISPFNAQGKRQTSFSSVFVHPMIDDTIEIEVNPADVVMETFRASGAGGQHVNKTDSAVRLRHTPTGIAVECQQERSQHMNRDKAMKMLKSRLYEIELQKKNEEKDKLEASKSKIEWGAQIRSYVLDDRRVKDHRTNYQTFDTDGVLNGDIDQFLKSFLMLKKETAN